MPYLEDEISSEMAGRLSNKKSRDFPAAIASAYRRFDQATAAKLAEPGVRIDCKSKCAYCCHLKVDVQAIEVIALMRAVHALPEADIARVRQRARSRHAFIQGKSERELLGINDPCPLLRDGECSVYHARPMHCRKFHAQTVETCRYSHEHPTDLEAPHSQHFDLVQIGEALLLGVSAAIESAGLDGTSYDLGAALHEAFEGKGERRLRDGKKAFSVQATIRS